MDDTSVQTELNRVTEKFSNNTQLAAVLINGDETHFFGAIKNNNTIETLENRDAVFEIGSITKVFTSIMLATMVVRNELTLDQSAQSLLGYGLNNNIDFTLKQLANHTAGLTRIPSDMFWELVLEELRFRKNTNPYKDYDARRLARYLQHGIKQKKPGKYRYSNLGAGLLGFVLAHTTEKSYGQLLQEFILKPLKMNSSSTDRTNLIHRLVPGLDKKGRPTSNWDLAALTGAGGLCSTVEDLEKFIRANFDSQNAAFELARVETANVSSELSIALGWHIMKNKNGAVWHTHDGGTGGYRSAMVIDVENKKGVVVLSNVSGLHLLKGNFITALATRLMELNHQSNFKTVILST